jgi:hypothetical protein
VGSKGGGKGKGGEMTQTLYAHMEYNKKNPRVFNTLAGFILSKSKHICKNILHRTS